MLELSAMRIFLVRGVTFVAFSGSLRRHYSNGYFQKQQGAFTIYNVRQ